jgi:deoxyribonuclease V
MEWPTTAHAARTLQEQLRQQVVITDYTGPIRSVAGVDAGFDASGITHAAVVVLSFPELQPIEHALVHQPTRFPYIPGLLSFREAPAILLALEQLHTPPDLVVCDGHGIAHPRRFGIASHIGVIIDRPTIGCAKTLLIGKHEPLPEERGSHVPLHHNGEEIGRVVRTRTRVRPVYVSPGHLLGLDQAVELVMRCTPRYRLPETTRYAHNLASHGRIPKI